MSGPFVTRTFWHTPWGRVRYILILRYYGDNENWNEHNSNEEIHVEDHTDLSSIERYKLRSQKCTGITPKLLPFSVRMPIYVKLRSWKHEANPLEG